MSKSKMVIGAIVGAVVVVVAIAPRVARSDYRFEPSFNSGNCFAPGHCPGSSTTGDDALMTVTFSCDAMFIPNGCSPGQDSQSLAVGVAVDGFGIEGSMSVPQTNRLPGCVPSGSATVTSDRCAQLRAAVPTMGCEVTYTDEQGADNDRGPGSFTKITRLFLLCRGSRELLINSAQKVLQIGYGINH